MENFIQDLFQYDFLSRALAAMLFMSISCGIIGSYVVVKRIVFVSGGITHASFGGIGLAYFLGINPMWGATVFSVSSALGMEYLSSKSNLREDSAIGVIWAVGMALGILFTALTPGYLPNLMSFLFGNLLTVTDTVLFFNIALAVVLVFFFAFFYRSILYITFDKDYARIQGIPAGLFSVVLTLLTALTIVAVIKLSGVVLLVSMLTIPANIANLISARFSGIIGWSVLFSFLGSVAGLLLSYATDIPCGASIVIVLSLLFFLVKTARFITFVKSPQKA